MTNQNWKNKSGTSDRKCACGTWKKHWLNGTNQTWPLSCSIESCSNVATLGAHVINSQEEGEFIVPACSSCNQRQSEFNLKLGTKFVRANQSETCS